MPSMAIPVTSLQILKIVREISPYPSGPRPTMLSKAVSRSVINIHDKTPGSKDTCQIHTSGGRYPTYQFFSSNPESFALVTQKWQHLAVSVSGKVIRFYENGEKVYSQELEGGEANQFSNIIIGKNRRGGRKYNGNIDDVYAHNRAINVAEVVAFSTADSKIPTAMV